jgi:hypothetical protein
MVATSCLGVKDEGSARCYGVIMLHVMDPQGRSSIIQTTGCCNIDANTILVKQVATGLPPNGNIVIHKAKWRARRNADAVRSWWKHVQHGQCCKQCA